MNGIGKKLLNIEKGFFSS